MKHYKYIILGGGVVAGYAAQKFTSFNHFHGEDLAIISADQALPYDRPPLSKDYLGGDKDLADIRINQPEFYRREGIDVYLNTHISQIYTTARTLRTEDGQAFSFDKLLIATGASANRLDIPGADLPHVYYLRWINDSATIRDRMEEVDDVVIIGGGYIGMEAAAVAAGRGKNVTMVFPNERVMGHRFFTPRLSQFFETALSDAGVTFIRQQKPTAFAEADDGILVTLESGEILKTGMVIAGIGASPNVEIFKDNGLKLDDGLVVDEYLETNIPGVYAAGDIANFYDVIFQKRRRTEHWQNAVDTGNYAAARMVGAEQEPFKALRYFFSDVLEYSYEVWGEIADGDTLVETGDYDSGSVGIWWLKEGRVVAALLMNRPDEEREQAQQWIRERKAVRVDDLPQVIERQPV